MSARVGDVLRRLVDQLNDLDDPVGFIETDERELLIRRIDELGSLVGLDNDDEKLTGHREW